jgi:hypothetical protein
MTIKEWVKANAKDGSNFAEFDELLSAYEVPTDITEAKAFVYKNKALLSAFDDEVRVKIEAHDKKFTENNLPKILKEEREKLVKELNPEETPKDKAFRELTERFNTRENELDMEKRKAALRAKASEIGFDPQLAEEFAGFGDEAELKMSKVKEYIDTASMSKVEAETKKRFGNTAPVGGNRQPASSAKEQLMKTYNERLASGDNAGANLAWLQAQKAE